MAPGWERVLVALMEELGPARERTWLVGGCLRDALLGLPIGDVDIVTATDPLAVAQRLQARLGASIGRLPRSVRIVVPPSGDAGPVQVDISALTAATIEGDLRQRDFTVNAMALPLPIWRMLVAPRAGESAPPSLVDPTGGLLDLTQRLLRPASRGAFQDDAGRLIRGARLIASHQLTPVDETLALAVDASPLLGSLSADRLRDELDRLLAALGCAEGLAFLDRVGALRVLFPELSKPVTIRHALDSVRWTDRLQRSSGSTAEVDVFGRETPIGRWYAAPLSNGAPRVTALRWGLLLHTMTSHREDELLAARIAGVERATPGPRRLLHGPERPIAYEIEARASFTARQIALREPDERDLRLLFAVAGEVTVDVLVAAAACANAQLAEGTMPADEARLASERVRVILDLYFAEPTRLIPAPLLSGRDLIQELGVAPGSEIHRLLAVIREAQLDGRVTSRVEALALAREARGQ